MKKAILLMSLVLALPTWAAEVRTTGERFDDSIAAIDTQGGRQVVTFASGKALPLADVKEVRFSDRAPAISRDAHVVLLSGDELFGTIGDEVKKGESFKLITASLGAVEVSLDAVSGIIFDASPEAARRLRVQLAAPHARDSFTLKAGGGAQGSVQSFSHDGLVFRDTNGTVWPPFPLKRLATLAVASGPTARGPSGLGARVRLADGSVVTGAIVHWKDGRLDLGRFSADTKDLLALEVVGGSVVYLSDLDPVAVDEHFPDGMERDSSVYCWKRDREVCEGGRLRVGGREYFRGLGVHSFSSLTFSVDGYREFRAVIGIDNSIRYLGNDSVGNVTFRVLLDGKAVKEVRKKKDDAPDELAIPVAGAKQLTLVADYGSYLHVLGRADWADAHLVK